MIILDACVIRGMSLAGSDAEVLRALREAGTESVTAPEIALEELLAQKAIEHEEAHRAAKAALKRLRLASVRDTSTLAGADPEGVRKEWQERYARLFDVLPVKEEAFREGMRREMNTLPPAGVKGAVKVGARDSAIWLTAVEYARAHPLETVYFVSSNTKDFGKGGSYPTPMDKDIDGLGERFRHLVDLGEVLGEVAPSVEVSHEAVQSALDDFVERQPASAFFTMAAHQKRMFYDFLVTVKTNWVTDTAVTATTWLQPAAVQITPRSVSNVKGYRLGEHEWCTADVRWQATGVAMVPALSAQLAACFWDTRLLIPVTAAGTQPIVLSSRKPYAPGAKEVEWPAGVEPLAERESYMLASHNLHSALNQQLELPTSPAESHLLRWMDTVLRGDWPDTDADPEADPGRAGDPFDE
ncbi:PIN domain-containing protein [Streptomyces sp. NPDC018338]|uniref:PIN domain-containing protein n=1 Tax=Streptomyces sp. NPDC018338 TaxID=3157192 RepID=UPI0033CA4650